MTIEHQDTDIILIDNYEFTGEPDGVYFKRILPHWNGAVIGNLYKALFYRHEYTVTQIENEYYQAKYSAIEASLTGDVLILGMGLATLDQYLVTGTSWKWVEINPWLAANIVPVNGTVHEGDANDITFLETLGMFDTILVDFPRIDPRFDYTSIMNVGANIIEMTL